MRHGGPGLALDVLAVVCSWCSMWMSEVEMKVWMRGRCGVA